MHGFPGRTAAGCPVAGLLNCRRSESHSVPVRADIHDGRSTGATAIRATEPSNQMKTLSAIADDLRARRRCIFMQAGQPLVRLESDSKTPTRRGTLAPRT